jgi:hypothetical protein
LKIIPVKESYIMNCKSTLLLCGFLYVSCFTFPFFSPFFLLFFSFFSPFFWSLSILTEEPAKIIRQPEELPPAPQSSSSQQQNQQKRPSSKTVLVLDSVEPSPAVKPKRNQQTKVSSAVSKATPSVSTASDLRKQIDQLLEVTPFHSERAVSSAATASGIVPSRNSNNDISNNQRKRKYSDKFIPTEVSLDLEDEMMVSTQPQYFYDSEEEEEKKKVAKKQKQQQPSHLSSIQKDNFLLLQSPKKNNKRTVTTRDLPEQAPPQQQHQQSMSTDSFNQTQLKRRHLALSDNDSSTYSGSLYDAVPSLRYLMKCRSDRKKKEETSSSLALGSSSFTSLTRYLQQKQQQTPEPQQKKENQKTTSSSVAKLPNRSSGKSSSEKPKNDKIEKASSSIAYYPAQGSSFFPMNLRLPTAASRIGTFDKVFEILLRRKSRDSSDTNERNGKEKTDSSSSRKGEN